MKFNVKIVASGLTSSGSSVGFIDPKTVQDYYSEVHNTSSKNVTGLVTNSMFYLNDVPIVLSGNNGSALVDSINAKSEYHHFVASFADSKLTLKPLPMYSHLVSSIKDITPGITDTLGFVNPDDTSSASLPASKVESISKSRGNWRWVYVIESLQQTSNIDIEFKINPASADVDTAPTEIEFLLTVPETYHSYNSSNQIVFGDEAVKQAVSKALLRTGNDTLEIYYDPTTTVSPLDPNVSIPKNLTLEKIEIGALTTSPSTAYNAITVTAI